MTRSIIVKSNQMSSSDVNTGYIRSLDMNSSVPDEGDDHDSNRPERTQPLDITRVSRRGLRLAAIDGEVGSDDKAKGKVRLTALGGLEYWSEDRKDAAKSTWGRYTDIWSGSFRTCSDSCSPSSVP